MRQIFETFIIYYYEQSQLLKKHCKKRTEIDCACDLMLLTWHTLKIAMNELVNDCDSCKNCYEWMIAILETGEPVADTV